MNIKKHLPWLGALLPVVNMQAETKPNVVIIYIDDMGIGDIGCYGGKFVPTPNIDKIAQDGLLFNQYYSSGTGQLTFPLRTDNRDISYNTRNQHLFKWESC